MNVKSTPTVRVQWGGTLRLVLSLFALTVLFLGGNLVFNSPATAAPAGAPRQAINPGCINLIADGDFEQFSPAWQIQGSNRPPAYSTQQAFGSTQSMRIGNGLELPDIESVSEVRHQPVLLPYGATSLILRFVYWPLYEATPGLTDLQQVDLFDATTNQLILPLLNVQDNKRDWKAVDYDLTAYAGRAVSLRFRVRNDGQSGRTLMFVDNVELEYCAATPIPTYTPTSIPAVTNTPLPTWTAVTPGGTFTPFPTNTPINFPTPIQPTPGGIPTADPLCSNILDDPGFEGWGGWHFGEDPVPAQYVSDVRLAGNYALLLGNPPGYQTNVKTFSSVRQLVTIPYDATHAELRWWKLLRTEQAGLPGPLTDRQDVVFLDPALNTIEVPRRELRNENYWQEDYINVTRYRGRTFYVYFNAFNDGNGARTWMYLDNVQLNVCGTTWRGGRGNLVSTPVAIVLTPPATYTQAPLPTPSPLPTQFVLPAEFPTETPTPVAPTPIAIVPTTPVGIVPTTAVPTAVAAVQATATPTAPATVSATATPTTVPATVVTVAVEPTTNVYALPTPTASFLVETTTATVVTTPAESGITVQPPQVVVVTPAPAGTSPAWVERLGPISVLLGVLVLIGFIVWAILQTFRSSRP